MEKGWKKHVTFDRLRKSKDPNCRSNKTRIGISKSYTGALKRVATSLSAAVSCNRARFRSIHEARKAMKNTDN